MKPNERRILELTTMLTAFPSSDSVNNFYKSPSLVGNVTEYFKALLSYSYSGDLLVGEAPGHAGCALTGIPFTSEHILANNSHPFIVAIRPRLFRSGTQKEQTATRVWDYLSRRPRRLPAFWNTFPFHPHPLEIKRNRPPKPAEARSRFGVRVLDLVICILTPRRVLAVGRVAEAMLLAHFAHRAAPYIHHPARSGNSAFVSDLTR